MRTGKTISKATREAFKKTLAFAQIQEWCKIHQLSRQKADSLLSKVIKNTLKENLREEDSLIHLFPWSASPEGFNYWYEIFHTTINSMDLSEIKQ